MAVETKNFTFEIKSIDEDQGIIKGYLSVFNNIDSQKDRVRPGAFKKTIADALQRKSSKSKKYLWPLLWMHDPEKPIGGFIDAEEDKTGLFVTAQLDISTNDQGIPLNPLATSVFSGFKCGYIDELSIGYKAIQKDYDAEGVRDLKEVQLWEGSAVTMLFAANDAAQVTAVKKASGSGDMPIADRDIAWSKSKAIKDIEAATGGDWSKAGKYFFWTNGTPEKEADCKLPFCMDIGGSMKAIPRGIFAVAGVLNGARGGAEIGGDEEAVKAKVAHYYERMAKQFNDDSIAVPWKAKSASPGLQYKDFNDRYQQNCISDWLYSDFDNLTQALRGSIIDMFMIGDEPEADLINTILNSSDDNRIGFIDALRAYVQKGIDLGVSDYLQEQGTSSRMYYMSGGKDDMERKTGRAISAANGAAIGKAVKNMQDTMMAHKAVTDMHYKTLANVADDLSALIGSPAYANEDQDEQEQAAESNGNKSVAGPSLTPTNENELTAFADWLRLQISK